MKAILLSRVSTLGQDIQQQTNVVKERIISDGYNDKDIIIIETHESAVKNSEEQRLGLTELKEHIMQDPTINAVYAYELSRIGRRPDVNYSIREFLRTHKVQLIILNPDIVCFNNDFSINPNANIVFGLFNSLAENEGYLRKERMKRGKANAKLQGRHPGGKTVYGYRTDFKTKKPYIFDDEANIVRELFTRYISGESCGDIYDDFAQRHIFPFTKAHNKLCKISRIVHNETYKGTQIYPAIITNEMYEKAMARCEHFKNIPRKTHNTDCFLLRGLVKTIDGHYTLHCSGANKYYIDKNTNTTMRYYVLDKIVIDTIYFYLKTHESYEKKTRNTAATKIITIKKRIEILNKHIQELKDKIENIWVKNIDGKISDEKAKQMEDETRKEINTTQMQINRFENDLASNNSIITKFENDKEVSIYDMDNEQKKQAIREYIKEVRVQKSENDIKYIHIYFKDGEKHVIKYYYRNNSIQVLE